MDKISATHNYRNMLFNIYSRGIRTNQVCIQTNQVQNRICLRQRKREVTKSQTIRALPKRGPACNMQLQYVFCKKSILSQYQRYPKVMKKVFNWSEVHSNRSNFLQNPYFSQKLFSSKVLQFSQQLLRGIPNS